MGKPHFLLLPYSEQGHFNPMLSLASQLAALGCKVTFIKADHRQAETCESDSKSQAPAGDLSAANPQAEATNGKLQAAEEAKLEDSQKEKETEVLANLQFVTLPARKSMVIDPSTDARAVMYRVFEKKLASLEERQDLIAKMVEDSKASPHPITCIICDWMLWRWVRHIVKAYGLHSALLSIFNALTLLTGRLTYIGGKDKELEDLYVSGFGIPSLKDVAAYNGLKSMKDSPEVTAQNNKYAQALFEGIDDAGPILLNSFKDLEAPLLPLLEASGLDVRFIGPCFPAWNENDKGLGNKMAQQAGSKFTEDEACLSWLDLQEKGSVLFVAFGSEGTVEAKQVEEIAKGIENSGYKFLWVFLSRGPTSSGPTQFFQEEGSKHEKGMFVAWAPQRKVLQHPAIGGFLTHSGWGSTLESLTSGVPMLCLPLLADQPIIANLVHYHLKIGIRLPVSQDGLVHREDVANCVHALMQGQLSDRVSKFRQSAKLAIQDAHHTLVSFVQAMK